MDTLRRQHPVKNERPPKIENPPSSPLCPGLPPERRNEENPSGEDQTARIQRLCHIGVALSAEKNLGRLLQMILTEARNFTHADAGSIYLVDHENRLMRFEILQNDTLRVNMTVSSELLSSFPSIPLEIDGAPNYHNVSTYVALTGKTVNIPDVYHVDHFDFTGPRKYDAATGYRSQSMLVMPMSNHENEIIGVLQLINAKDVATAEVIAFSEAYVELIASLASQAAVAVTNAQLIRNLKDLFKSFIKSIATAIDEKSPYTGGHIRRVVDITTMIVKQINATDEGPLAQVHFSEDEMEEVRMAAWMHDVGKIITPEHVINKSTRLETIFDRVQMIETRFDLIRHLIENRYLAQKLRLLEHGFADASVLKTLEADREQALMALDTEREFIKAINRTHGFISDADLARLQEIAGRTYELDGHRYPYLTPEEFCNLSIRKGNLTAAERKLVEDHVLMTIAILKELPFPRNLSRLLEYAGGHHERPDGSGYPSGCCGDQLSLQARIIAFADIFESLTAQDRPYKKPLNLSQTIEILNHMKNENHIDPHLLELFVRNGLHQEYARLELQPEQIDPT
jgi:HD-GYP domain-containing protein (c-di-GMP phosphodiesterase class II)